MEDEKALYEKKAEAKLKEIGAKIDELRAKSEQAQANLQIDLKQRIDKLASDRQRLKTSLDQLKKSGQDAFGDLKAGMELALTDLRTAIDSAFQRIRK